MIEYVFEYCPAFPSQAAHWYEGKSPNQYLVRLQLVYKFEALDQIIVRFTRKVHHHSANDYPSMVIQYSYRPLHDRWILLRREWPHLAWHDDVNHPGAPSLYPHLNVARAVPWIDVL